MRRKVGLTEKDANRCVAKRSGAIGINRIYDKVSGFQPSSASMRKKPAT